MKSIIESSAALHAKQQRCGQRVSDELRAVCHHGGNHGNDDNEVNERTVKSYSIYI